MIYPSAQDVERNVRILWDRRHGDLAEYHRKMIRSELSRLRYLRSK